MRIILSLLVSVFFLVQYSADKITVCETRQCAEQLLSKSPWSIEQIIKVEISELGIKAYQLKIKHTRVFSLEMEDEILQGGDSHGNN
jgi:hypothetical protein